MLEREEPDIGHARGNAGGGPGDIAPLKACVGDRPSDNVLEAAAGSPRTPDPSPAEAARLGWSVPCGTLGCG